MRPLLVEHTPINPLAMAEAQILHEILWRDPKRRRTWQRRIQRQSRRPATIHQAAVAHVLAEWLWEVGEVSEGECLLPRRLKDSLSRALSGRTRLPVLLKEAVIGAFDVEGPQADLLRDASATLSTDAA